ncbi:MAG: hypothetical protein WBC92_11455, partial [Terracidiphilus sp.]
PEVHEMPLSRIRFDFRRAWFAAALLLLLWGLSINAAFAQNNYGDYAAACRANGGTPYPSPARCIFGSSGGNAAPVAGGTQGYNALGAAIGNAISCALFHGPGCPQRRSSQEVHADIAAANAREAAALEQQRLAEAAHDDELAAAAAERARLAHAQFLADRDQLATMLRGDLSATTGLRGDDASASGLREDDTPVLAAGTAHGLSIWGKEPPLPTSVGRSLASGISPSVDSKAATDYIGRALDFMRQNIEQTALKEGKKSALSGEMFAETEMGPYGMATVVMVNVAQLPDFVVGKISGVVTGSTSNEDAESLTVQASNRIFDFNTPVNAAVRNGALNTVKDEISGSIEDSTKKGLASLAAEFLPVKDEVKQSLAENATKISDTATDAFKHIFTTDGDDQ